MRQIRSHSRVVLTPLSCRRDQTELISRLQSPPAMDEAAGASSSASGTFLLMLALVKCTNRSSMFPVLYLQQVSQQSEQRLQVHAITPQALTCGSQNGLCPDCIQMPEEDARTSRGHISCRVSTSIHEQHNRHRAYHTSNQI